MSAGMVIANGTAIPAISKPRNKAVTIRSWSSGDIALAARAHQSPKRFRSRNQGRAERKAEREHAERHGQPRQPLWGCQIARRHVAEPPGRELEPYELPGEQRRRGEREP